MTRILLLAYYFPPIGGAGAQRNTKVAKYLPGLGYDLTVVTGPGASGRRWTPIDESLGGEIDPRVRVARVAETEPPRGATRKFARVERWLRVGTAWQAWWERNAVPLAIEIGRDADLVYASLAPFETADAAVEVARRLGLPLVLDLEDPWALDEMFLQETALHARLELRAMRRALSAADGIVMNTPEAVRRVRERFPRLPDVPITAILNGYDAADFDGVAPARDDETFRIVHTGSLHSWGKPRLTRRLLGGEPAGVNVLSRSLMHLLPALGAALDTRPDLRDRVEIHLAGSLTASDRADLAAAPARVVEHGFLSHPESVALLRTADLLFLPMHDYPGRRVAIVPCKTYEYLGSRRPILAAVPEGDARDMLLEAGNATVTSPTDEVALASALVAALDAWQAGLPAQPPSPSLVKRIERRHLMGELEQFIGRIVRADERPAAA
jgi:glycosyltransferase involved in cell wall biosynthesis